MRYPIFPNCGAWLGGGLPVNDDIFISVPRTESARVNVEVHRAAIAIEVVVEVR